LAEIFDFFDTQQPHLVEAAIQNKNGKSGRKTTPRSVTTVLTNFQEAQAALYDKVGSRVEVFDARAQAAISILLENHQDKVTVALFKGREEVIIALADAKTELMQAIRAADR
jgi:UDP-N-acetyl-D-mannosaminuronate dehydrogenase